MIKGSDLVANFLEEKKIKVVFGIIGAGNAHIFDSIQTKGYTKIVCVHHEQAACMAMQTYYRVSGNLSAAILTTGAGSTNGITGVVSAWADSIPGLIISGNEHSKYIELHKNIRMWGVQGYDSALMVEKVTKYSTRVLDVKKITEELSAAYEIALQGRKGPCWVDIPMNIQSEKVNEEEVIKFSKEKLPKLNLDLDSDLIENIDKLLSDLSSSKRPLFWFGNGVRLSNANSLLEPLLNQINIPTILSWAGIDMIDSNHPLVFGRAGTYGQRCANLVLQNCDLLISVGTRLSISQIGYDITELARDAKIVVVDIDKSELEKYKDRYSLSINADAKDFLTGLTFKSNDYGESYEEWIKLCNHYRTKYPWVSEWEHPDLDGFINSYTFIDKLNHYLKKDQIIVTDMGTALLSGHQVLRIKQGQRLMTSTGLGEMGYGLPAAIGASFGSNRGEIMCLNCDGGMMMNLQELQTIIHYKLPIKIFVFNNDGYLMIKHTQNALFNGRRAGVDSESGVTCPDYSAIAGAFGIPAFQIRSWYDFEKIIPEVQDQRGPVICEVFMHPNQLFVPKLSLAIQSDGTLISPPLEDLSPFITREELKNNMIGGLHVKSELIEVK